MNAITEPLTPTAISLTMAAATPAAITAIHPALVEVALIDGATAAAAGGMKLTWWNDEVRAGRAPQPAIRGYRCTRYRLVDVLEFWKRRAENGSPEAAKKVNVIADKASQAACAKRLAKRQSQAVT